ncbi:glycerol kinase [Paractinoplanes abujensis]|uniref:Glycerol kinase n=1 Tax=Paractinoplanes abujensis TaxID=882441 RepID=A0A7W7G4R5_9ACTN|nr:glycerol kinase GlpK [Actinoplanes abujensis]MBB4695904.1 glycerol kinase [Actinoplanes abujensis]GID23494.1 glycerol kinase [Actinoplanes abujensis]
MSERYVLAIDQGTTSTRCILFDRRATVVSVVRGEHRQSYPRPGWVEHDAARIWRDVQRLIERAMREAGIGPAQVAAIGIANQRETVVVWDKASGTPVAPAIVWQDTRTSSLLDTLDGSFVRERTGLPLAAYFSATKVRWLLDNTPGLRARATRGEVLFGTMDSWLIWNLTGGKHLTDVTNASRTMLMNLATLSWDPDLLDMFDIPRAMLPEIRSSSEVYGEAFDGVPIAGVLGDQQAALFGQTCFDPGDTKCTYGTGGFLLMNTGSSPVWSSHGLITTVGYQIGTGQVAYALEGSIAIAGSLVQWVRDGLGLIGTASEIETLAGTVGDNGGCYIVPAFSGLYAPYWESEARGVIVGLTSYITKGHLARAVLEATGWQTRDVVDAMNADSGLALTALNVDGGMTADNLLMQIIADFLQVPVVRPMVAETVSVGAAYTAGLAVGYWSDLRDLRHNRHSAGRWKPGLDEDRRAAEYANWKRAVESAVFFSRRP